MAARLGEVLYWAFAALAAALLAFGVYLSNVGPDTGPLFWVFGIIAVISWLVGRAARYILSGA